MNEDNIVQSQYLSFQVAGAEYAIPILRAREIIRYTTSTVVPMAPEPIRGLINIRGRAVPVVDLAVYFGLEETADSDRACVVVVDFESSDEDTVMGILTEGVNEVIGLTEADIEAAPAFGTDVKAEYATGMGRVDGRFIPILDVECLLTLEAPGASQRFAASGAAALETAPEAELEQSELSNSPPAEKKQRARDRKCDRD